MLVKGVPSGFRYWRHYFMVKIFEFFYKAKDWKRDDYPLSIGDYHLLFFNSYPSCFTFQ